MRSANQSTLSLWYWHASGSWRAASAPAAWELDAVRLTAEVSGQHRPNEVVISQLHQVPGFVGALLVAQKWSRQVFLNGVPLAAGMHLVRHADRVDIFQQTFWLSTKTSVEETTYDPALHGDEVFCFLTKARLAAGQPIRICPGLPGTGCGVIYKAAAWDMAMQSESPMRCPNCSYRPGEGEWHPPATKTRRTLDGIQQLLGK